MSRQSNTVGVLPGSFTQQVIKAISQQSIPSFPPVGWKIIAPTLVTVSLVAAFILSFGTNQFSDENGILNSSGSSDNLAAVFLVMASEERPFSANQGARKTHTLPANEPGAVVWGNQLDIEGMLQIAEPVSAQGSLWASSKSPVGLEKWMKERTKIALRLLHRQVGLDSPDLLKHPLLLISGNKPLKLTPSERANLKTYLLEKKGFLFVDEVPGGTGGFTRSVANTLKEIIPNSKFKPIPQESEVHLLYQCFYQMGGPPRGARSGTETLSGTFMDSRLLAAYSDRNYWHYLTVPIPQLSQEKEAEIERRRATLQKWQSEVEQWLKDGKKGKKPKFQEPDMPEWMADYFAGLATKRFFSNVIFYAVTRGNIADYSAYQHR
jgi:hypothetical protein